MLSDRFHVTLPDDLRAAMAKLSAAWAKVSATIAKAFAAWAWEDVVQECFLKVYAEKIKAFLPIVIDINGGSNALGLFGQGRPRPVVTKIIVGVAIRIMAAVKYNRQ